MKKLLIATALLFSSAICYADIDTYNGNEAKQYAYCSGAFLASAELSMRMGLTENVPTLRLGASMAAKHALSLDRNINHTMIAREAAGLYDDALSGDTHAQTVISDDLDTCVNLLLLLK